jgi:PAS domain S-box-containing protein
LDTPPEERFDHITRLAQHIFKVPVSLISLVDSDRIWFKSRQGLNVSESPRDISFCGHAISEPTIIVVPDASVDARFADNPFVTGAAHFRFYAGCPLSGPDGSRVGVLCLLDRQPRQITENDRSILQDLGTMVEYELNSLTLAEANQQLRETQQELRLAKEKLEIAFHSSEEKYQQLFAAESDALILIDVETLRLIEANHSSEKLFGYTREEFDRLKISDLSAEPEKTIACVQGTQSDPVTRSYRRKDGRVFPVEINFSRLLLNDRKMILAAIRDISERQRMQSALIQSEKMAAVGQFAAGLAHDINNPVGVIWGFAQHLLSNIAENAPSFVPLKAIEREALRCRNLVQNLLAFSRTDKDQTHTKPEDLFQITENALTLVATLSLSRKVTLKRPTRKPLPPVPVNSTQIQQVLINLCMNALDAMPNGGELTVELDVQGSDALIRVQDTGSGIPADVCERIFEPFFTTKEAGKGTGLGLSITSEIVKKHSGRIDVQSDVGKGTTFIIHLPLEQPKEADSKAPRQLAA